MIAIIDYGMGNLGSVSNACAYLRLPAQMIVTPEDLKRASAVILPGVGAFGDCMDHLRRTGFEESLRGWILAGRPFLGICLGLQVLYEGSEESPGVRGLGILSGLVRRFPQQAGLKIPQIAWNRVRLNKANFPLFRNIPDGAYFYFVHSYYAPQTGSETDAALTCYGVEYVSAVWRERMAAVQFHPEKSQLNGLQLLTNFAEWIA